MRKWFRKIWHNVHKDKLGNYHKYPCHLAGRKFTVIDNACGKKVGEWSIKYCPICGEKLEG